LKQIGRVNITSPSREGELISLNDSIIIRYGNIIIHWD